MAIPPRSQFFIHHYGFDNPPRPRPASPPDLSETSRDELIDMIRGLRNKVDKFEGEIQAELHEKFAQARLLQALEMHLGVSLSKSHSGHQQLALDHATTWLDKYGSEDGEGLILGVNSVQREVMTSRLRRVLRASRRCSTRPACKHVLNTEPLNFKSSGRLTFEQVALGLPVRAFLSNFTDDAVISEQIWQRMESALAHYAEVMYDTPLDSDFLTAYFRAQASEGFQHARDEVIRALQSEAHDKKAQKLCEFVPQSNIRRTINRVKKAIGESDASLSGKTHSRKSALTSRSTPSKIPRPRPDSVYKLAKAGASAGIPMMTGAIPLPSIQAVGSHINRDTTRTPSTRHRQTANPGPSKFRQVQVPQGESSPRQTFLVPPSPPSPMSSPLAKLERWNRAASEWTDAVSPLSDEISNIVASAPLPIGRKSSAIPPPPVGLDILGTPPPPGRGDLAVWPSPLHLGGNPSPRPARPQDSTVTQWPGSAPRSSKAKGKQPAVPIPPENLYLTQPAGLPDNWVRSHDLSTLSGGFDPSNARRTPAAPAREKPLPVPPPRQTNPALRPVSVPVPVPVPSSVYSNDEPARPHPPPVVSEASTVALPTWPPPPRRRNREAREAPEFQQQLQRQTNIPRGVDLSTVAGGRGLATHTTPSPGNRREHRAVPLGVDRGSSHATTSRTPTTPQDLAAGTPSPRHYGRSPLVPATTFAPVRSTSSSRRSSPRRGRIREPRPTIDNINREARDRAHGQAHGQAQDQAAGRAANLAPTNRLTPPPARSPSDIRRQQLPRLDTESAASSSGTGAGVGARSNWPNRR